MRVGAKLGSKAVEVEVIGAADDLPVLEVQYSATSVAGGSYLSYGICIWYCLLEASVSHVVQIKVQIPEPTTEQNRKQAAEPSRSL